MRPLNRLRQRRLDRKGVKPAKVVKPDTSWSVDGIKYYLKENNIEFTGSHNTKAKLLALLK